MIFTHDDYNWSGVISSFLPNLQALSFKSCNLSGPLDSSLAKLKNLSVIRLDGNTFSSAIPDSYFFKALFPIRLGLLISLRI
ncbi:hypothetical protein M8C21_018093 [Ambrosia artemisiifolia]|uniref:Uncharacterized protein n=1 Tax=Ambrosia artemisiifolia TaxID=4212 RepID=A0AAD5CKZ9_AMBAR|nr:hypothetical protein M8C21_018093 [Ambrosia artemisiifolia]